MTKRLKLILIIVSVVLLATASTAIGLTAAIWTGTSGGASEYGPVVLTNDWNSWRKYFDYEVYTHEDNGDTIFDGCAIYGYDGTNLGDIIFPPTIGGSNYQVTELKNTIFRDATKKDLPVAIYISGNITSISANTFCDLPNLEVVVFAAGSEVNVGEYAFAFCQNLKTVVIEGSRTVNFATTSFAGCSALTSITGETLSDYQI